MRQVAFAIAMLIALSARADDQAQARQLYHEATKHYRLGEYSQALDSFKGAYRAYPDGSFLFNIGQCERQLNHKPEAVRAYRSYLAEMPNAPNAAQVRKLIDNLEQLIAQENAGREGPPTETLPPSTGMPANGATTTPPQQQPTASPALTATTQAPPRKQPLYKKWWLWTVVGVVVVGAGVGLGVGLGAQPKNPQASIGGVTF